MWITAGLRTLKRARPPTPPSKGIQFNYIHKLSFTHQLSQFTSHVRNNKYLSIIMQILLGGPQFEFIHIHVVVIDSLICTGFTAGPNTEWDVLSTLRFCTGRGPHGISYHSVHRIVYMYRNSVNLLLYRYDSYVNTTQLPIFAIRLYDPSSDFEPRNTGQTGI